MTTLMKVTKASNLQALKNKVPKDIVELIIKFVPSNFNTMKYHIERLLPLSGRFKEAEAQWREISEYKTHHARTYPSECPFDVKKYLALVDEKETLLTKITGRLWGSTTNVASKIQPMNRLMKLDTNGEGIDIYAFDVYIEKIQIIIQAVTLIRDTPKCRKTVFYPEDFPETEEEYCLNNYDPLKDFIPELYKVAPRTFAIEKMAIGKKKHLLYFKITAKSKQDKTDLINFFKGVGHTLEWIKRHPKQMIL